MDNCIDQLFNGDVTSKTEITERLIREDDKVEDARAIINQHESIYTLKYTTYYNLKDFGANGILLNVSNKKCHNWIAHAYKYLLYKTDI